MHGARLAKKPRAELFEHPVHFDQRAPELVSAAGIVRNVLAVVFERNRDRDLDRHCPDPHLQPERFQPIYKFAVKIGNRAGRQRQAFRRPIADLDHQPMVDKIEVDLEAAPALMRDRRGGQSPAGDIKRHLPPMVHHRRLRQANLADDLFQSCRVS